MKQSRGTQIPASLRAEVRERDRGCVGARLGWPGEHRTALEMDHVRASGALGRKSETSRSNAVMLCLECHLWKTSNGRLARPQLVAYLDQFYGATDER